MLPREVFLSHSGRDREFATELAEVLRRHGVPVWYSRTNILGAQQWHDEIGAALKRCHWFIIVLSPHAVRSMWVKNELLFALNHRRFRNKIIPLLYRSCRYERLSWTLSNFEIIDFRASVEDGCRELLRVWGLGYAPLKRRKRKVSRGSRPR